MIRKILSRDACASHQNDRDQDRVYDTNGHLCQSLSAEDRIFLAASLSACGLVLCLLASIAGRRWYKRRSRARRAQLEAGPAMSSMGTPLIQQAGAFGTVSRQLSHPPASPLSSTSSSDSSHGAGSLYSDSSSPRSLYSPSSEAFHFPILSADGHLLPPPPASSRRSIVEVNPFESDARPLPSAPLSPPVPLHAPVPKASNQWSYRSPLDSDLHDGGLYPGVDIPTDGSTGMLASGLGIGTTRIASSPMISQVEYSDRYEPHQATYHRTPTVEGDDYSVYDYGSERGYQRL
ncbi:hypothetical protein IAU60_006234 [Kwoniella sp. DSM 27419]